ncbi:MAG: hypothetical protein ACK47B_18150 [Armatimonadota bacterium]
MNRWMTTLAAGALALSFTGSALAQAPAKPAQKPAAQDGQRAQRGQRGQARLKAALDKLGLTADQKTKVDALMKNQAAEMKKLREAPGTPQEKRPKMREAAKQFRSKLEAILTAEQKTKLREMQREARRNRQNGGARTTPAKPAAPKA